MTLINKMWNAIFNIWENQFKEMSQQKFILTSTYIGDIYQNMDKLNKNKEIDLFLHFTCKIQRNIFLQFFVSDLLIFSSETFHLFY